MLESRDDDRFRPTPVQEEWNPQSMDGVVGVRIEADPNGESSSTEWLWSSRWLDAVAKR
ncbi:hypothetical protein [Natronorubrum daqingense]|uniref:Uncharacterized protein n=1 Tax=Natronorubrum daqingense TaxID=588898 RepID=A0A1N7D6Z9_9EURY|nr:hypothetical protein [Natronorubrum daqingense]SIR71623.1 hypothetical protein SAMN05421809_2108 [Natronorubrum daqingense]